MITLPATCRQITKGLFISSYIVIISTFIYGLTIQSIILIALPIFFSIVINVIISMWYMDEIGDWFRKHIRCKCDKA